METHKASSKNILDSSKPGIKMAKNGDKHNKKHSYSNHIWYDLRRRCQKRLHGQSDFKDEMVHFLVSVDS